MSRIELKWTDRKIGTAQTRRRFLDFVVDGQSMYEQLGERITPLGWGNADESRKFLDRLLRKAAPDLPNGRTSIYVCSECGDLGCGAVSAVIQRVGDNIVWRDFGYENNYDDIVNFEDLDNLGPFIFNATEYYQVISSALDIKEDQ